MGRKSLTADAPLIFVASDIVSRTEKISLLLRLTLTGCSRAEWRNMGSACLASSPVATLPNQPGAVSRNKRGKKWLLSGLSGKRDEQQTQVREQRGSYSCCSATIGSTRKARRAGA
jgi:hypothetical protein